MYQYYFFEKISNNKYYMEKSPKFETQAELDLWTFYEKLAVETSGNEVEISDKEFEQYVEDNEDICLIKSGSGYNYVNANNEKQFYQDIICSVVRKSFTMEDLDFLATSFADYSPF